MKCAFALSVAFLLCTTTAAAAEQSRYPIRPIRVIVAFGPGGIADTIARLVGQKLADRLGQPVVIDNRGGAGGIVGAKLAAGAPADGHTLLVTTSAVAVNAHAKEPFDPRASLTPVALVASTPTIFAVHGSVSANGLMDYVRGAKAGRFTFSTAGIGTTEHLTAEFVFRAAGLQATHVPFQGGTAPVAAVVGQQVDLTSTTYPTSSNFIKQGSLKVLAVASRKRVAILRDVPTIGESGFPEFENASWVAFFAPAKAPPDVVRKLNVEVNDALRQPDVRERLGLLGFDPHAGSSAEFADYLGREVSKWGSVIKATGILPQ